MRRPSTATADVTITKVILRRRRLMSAESYEQQLYGGKLEDSHRDRESVPVPDGRQFDDMQGDYDMLAYKELHDDSNNIDSIKSTHKPAGEQHDDYDDDTPVRLAEDGQFEDMKYGDLPYDSWERAYHLRQVVVDLEGVGGGRRGGGEEEGVGEAEGEVVAVEEEEGERRSLEVVPSQVLTRGQRKGSHRVATKASSTVTVGTKQKKQQVKAKLQRTGGGASTGYENRWLDAAAQRLGLKAKKGKSQAGSSGSKSTGKSSGGKTQTRRGKGIGGGSSSSPSSSSSSRPSRPLSSSNGGAGGSWWSRWWRKQTSTQQQQKQKQKQPQQRRTRTQQQQGKGKTTPPGSSTAKSEGVTRGGKERRVRAPLPRHGLIGKPPPTSGSGSTRRGGRTSGSVKPTTRTTTSGAGNGSSGNSERTSGTTQGAAIGGQATGGTEANVTEPMVEVMEPAVVDALVQVHDKAR